MATAFGAGGDTSVMRIGVLLEIEDRATFGWVTSESCFGFIFGSSRGYSGRSLVGGAYSALAVPIKGWQVLLPKGMLDGEDSTYVSEVVLTLVYARAL